MAEDAFRAARDAFLTSDVAADEPGPSPGTRWSQIESTLADDDLSLEAASRKAVASEDAADVARASLAELANLLGG